MERQYVKEALDEAFDEYVKLRVDELLGVAKGASRLSTERDVFIALGKAHAAKELHARVINALGL